MGAETTSKPFLSPRIAEALVFFLHSFVLFFLAAGRMTFDLFGFADIKVGENPENLLPMLILARYLYRGSNRFLPLEPVRPFAPGLFLILAGLLVALVSNPTFKGFEDVLRLIGQAGCGLLLADWIYDSMRKRDPIWAVSFFLGMVWLAIWTPWVELGNPNLEGPFPHRNIQSGFYLLSFPLLLFSARRIGNQPFLKGVPATVLLLVGIGFILLSKSRAGILGILVAGVGWFVLSFRTGFRNRRTLIAIGSVVGILMIAVTVFLFPRFRDFGQELGDPYHFSRSGIWAAVVDSWSQPSQWLVGIGMGESLHRNPVDSSIGNLNYRYRRALHPHSLYFQWMYWGGITALLGWISLFPPVWKWISSKESRWETRVLGTCLLGYAALELVECVLREPRVAALFWLNMALLGCLECGAHSVQSAAREIETPSTPGSEIVDHVESAT